MNESLTLKENLLIALITGKISISTYIFFIALWKLNLLNGISKN